MSKRVNKYIMRGVHLTIVSLAKLTMVDGEVSAEKLPDQVLLGDVSLEKAQKDIAKSHGHEVTVLEVRPEERRYKMDILDFIEVATRID